MANRTVEEAMRHNIIRTDTVTCQGPHLGIVPTLLKRPCSTVANARTSMPCRPESNQCQSCPHMRDPARPRCTWATASKNEPFCFRYSPAWPRAAGFPTLNGTGGAGSGAGPNAADPRARGGRGRELLVRAAVPAAIKADRHPRPARWPLHEAGRPEVRRFVRQAPRGGDPPSYRRVCVS